MSDGITGWSFAQAFIRNCPNVRLTKDEREELNRLFFECQKWAEAKVKPAGMSHPLAPDEVVIGDSVYKYSVERVSSTEVPPEQQKIMKAKP